jgi:hypothetical protein
MGSTTITKASPRFGGSFTKYWTGFKVSWIAVKADVANPGAGDKGEDPVEHDDSRAEDRDKDHRTGQFHPLGPLKRGLHLHRPHRKIPGYLVDHEGGELLQDLPELQAIGALIPKLCELGLDQRMVHQNQVLHDLEDYPREGALPS